jgi:hypothetical protein
MRRYTQGTSRIEAETGDLFGGQGVCVTSLGLGTARTPLVRVYVVLDNCSLRRSASVGAQPLCAIVQHADTEIWTFWGTHFPELWDWGSCGHNLKLFFYRLRAQPWTDSGDNNT